MIYYQKRGAKLKKVNLQITGMHCTACATVINKGLSKKEGVKETNVNFSTNKATVEFDDTKLSENDLVEIVKGRGYGAQIILEGKGASTLFDAQKKEKDEYFKKFLTGLVFAIPAFIIGMVLMWIGIDVPFSAYILWALATPV